MGLFPSDKFYQLQDVEELFASTIRRKHWNLIRPDLLKRIFDNAKGDAERIKEFVLLVERFGCVKRNFEPLQRIAANPLNALSSFSLTLLRLGGELQENSVKLREGSEKQAEAIAFATIGYWSAILCDRYQFAAYIGLIGLYRAVGLPGRVEEMCHLYDDVEEELRRADTSVLSDQNQLRRTDAEMGKMRSTLNLLKEQIGLPYDTHHVGG